MMGGPGGCKLDMKCFQFCPDNTLADAFPFVRQTPITCDKCQKLCNKLQGMGGKGPYQCASAVYDAQVGSCDIFAVSDQGMMGRKKRDCGGGGCGGGKQPHKQPYPGRIYLIPTGQCAGQGGNDTGAGGGGGGGGGGTTAAGGGGGATTVASTSAGATTAATPAVTSSSMRKKIRDQAPIRRKDDISFTGRCLAARTSSGFKDCTRGTRFVGSRRHQCVPTADECRDT